MRNSCNTISCLLTLLKTHSKLSPNLHDDRKKDAISYLASPTGNYAVVLNSSLMLFLASTAIDRPFGRAGPKREESPPQTVSDLLKLQANLTPSTSKPLA
jgi:hypothetical protein